MIADFPITKQPGKQGQRVLSESRVDEWGLSLKGLSRATAWFSVIVEVRVSKFRVKLGPFVAVVLPCDFVDWGLFQNELPGIGIVAKIKPVGNCSPLADCIPYCGPCRSCIHAPDYNIGTEVTPGVTSGDNHSCLQMNGHRLPFQSPE